MFEGFVEWKANRSSRTRLDVIGKVLEEYKADKIVLTLRQLFYQLVSKNIVLNTHREYKNLGELLSKARMAGMVDWDSLEDRVRRANEWQSFDTIQDCVQQAAKSFCLPRWNDQPEYVELWCEKDALSSVINPICDQLFTTYMVNRGYSSSSAMYDSRNRIERLSAGRDVHIIYLGDFDPSGEDMVRDIRDRFETFGVDLTVTKLALNLDQVARWKLPHNSAKTSDSRSGGFIDKHGNKSYEVDAIPPKDLQKMIKSAIIKHMDMDAYNRVVIRENLLRKRLVKAVSKIK